MVRLAWPNFALDMANIGLVDFALRLPGFSLIPGITIPIISYWDGQPLRYVLLNPISIPPFSHIGHVARTTSKICTWKLIIPSFADAKIALAQIRAQEPQDERAVVGCRVYAAAEGW